MLENNQGLLRKAIIKEDIYEIKRIFNIDEVRKDTAGFINKTHGHSLPTLYLAFSRFNHRIIKILIDNGADLNMMYEYRQETPLISEVKYGRYQNVYTLINHGCDIYTKDINGKNAMDYAREKGIRKIINLIENKDCENRRILHNVLYKKLEMFDRRCIDGIIEFIYKL